MTESNPVQVTLSDDGLKIIKTQNTADNAASGVDNLNDPNLMSVIEKQTQVSQFAGLTSQYNVLLARAKDASISTTDLTTAYTNLNTFMSAILTDTTKASDVDRDTYKSLTDAYNTALSNVQTALNDSFNTDIDNMQSSVSVASQAASSAVIVASQAAVTGDTANQVASRAIVVANDAQSAGNNAISVANNATSVANNAKSAADNTYAYANSEIAVQSTATAKAQSKADDAFSKATTAIDNGQVTSQAVTDLKDGSKLTIAELENGLATKVANSDYASYKEQTASQIGQLVTNGAFSAYQQTTADLISSKVATKDFSAYQDTTAKAIESKVESKDFNTYKTQTADTISQTVTNAISNISIGGTNLIANSANTITINGDAEHYKILYRNLTPGTWTFSSSAKYTQGSVTAVSVWVYDSGHKNIIIENNTVNIVNGRLTTTFTITDSAAKELLVYAGNNGYFSTVGNMLQLDHYKLEKGNKATDWAPAPEDLATQSQITQLSGEIDLRVTKGDLVDQINVQAGKTLISSSGQLILSGKSVVLDSVDPVIMKSANIGNMAVGTAQIDNLAITDAQVGNVSANKLTAGTIDFNTITGKNINASNITTGTLDTDRLNVNKLSALSADLGDVTAGSLKGVNIVANTFSTPNGSFTTDANGSVVASNLTIRGVTNLVYNAALLGGSGGNNSSIPGWNLFTNGYYSNLTLHDGVPSIGFNASTGSGAWVMFAQSKLYPLNGLTGQPYSASVWFVEYGSEADYQFTLAFYDANGNRLYKSYVGNTWNGNPTAQGWVYKTIDNAVSPSNAKYVGIQYWAHDGKGHALFSSPMLTQTAQSTGYQPDTGNIINAGQVILGNDGTLTTTYTGITQDSDSYYNSWTLKNGTLSIGQGYITSTATGNRVVSNVPMSADTVKGTLTAAYLKFTEPNIPARTYLDATHFTVSSNKKSDIVTIDNTGVTLQNDAALNGPVFDWSGDGVQSQNLIMGLSPHTINTTDKHEIAFQIGRGNTGDYANIHVWSVVTASQLSKKKEVIPYSDNGTVVANTSLATYRYNQDDNTDIMHVGPIIDDTNANKEWFIRPEIVSTAGELGGAEIDLPASIFYGWSAIKALQRENENLQIRLRKLEIEEGA